MPAPTTRSRISSRVVRAIPIAGDIFAAAAELVNPQERSAQQRLVNAGVVGVGGSLLSAGTAGLDAVPQLADLITEYTGIRGPQKLQQLQRCAPGLNSDRHLRDLAYRLGQGKATDFYKKELQAALSSCVKAFDNPNLRPTGQNPYIDTVLQGGMRF